MAIRPTRFLRRPGWPALPSPTTLGERRGRLVLALGVALAAGFTVAIDPRIGVAAGATVIAAIGLTLVAGRLVDVTLGALVLILAGYALMGRGFAYLGAAPLFVGEIVLVLVLVAWVRGPRARYSGPFPLLLVAFMAWGALATLPYLGIHGLDALRDAVTWGYGLFAVALAPIIEERHVRALVRVYAQFLPLFLVWVPLAGVLTQVVELPTMPGTTVPIVVFKGGDMGVLLAGAGAFLMVGLYDRARPWVRIPEPLLWVLWLGAVAVAGILNRGGLIAAATMGVTILSLRAAGRWVGLVVVALALLVPLTIINPRIDVGGNREFSMTQIIENIASVGGATDDAALEGTVSFRLAWWGTIVEYTFDGPYFWTGKGYGINLADDDGFQPTADGSLRAPHNGHLEILARSGVPGLVLWVLLQGAFGAMLLRTLARARALPDPWWSQLLLWVLTGWLASLVNSAFDPYLQGPQGGILFWSTVGLGLAVIRGTERAIAQRAEPGAPEESQAAGPPGRPAQA